MNEAITKRRNGRAMKLPVFSIHVERNITEIVLYAASYVYDPTPQKFVDLQIAVDRMSQRARRKK